VRSGLKLESDRAAVQRRIREAFLQAFYALAQWAERRAGSFSLLGIDYLIDRSLSVSLLESNCNCELFDDAKKFGQERADISEALVQRTRWPNARRLTCLARTNCLADMMDAVLSSNLDAAGFSAIVSAGALQRLPLELLYTEAVSPAWALVPPDACYPTL